MAFPAKDLTRSPMPTDNRLRHPLDRLRGSIRRYVSFEGLLTVLLFLAVWFWLDLLLDFGTFKLFSFDWVQETPRWIRAVLLAATALFVTLLVVRRIVFRLVREFSPDSLALVLEKKFPALLGDRLITAVQMADTKAQLKYGYSEGMILKTIDDARERVDQIPVGQVFDWGRLRRQALVLLLVTFGIFLISGGVIAAVRSMQPKRYLGEFQDVTGIWAERNILLRNTPWPRAAFLEVMEFPGYEKRIGRDQPSPRMKIMAYKWVWADSSAPEGWRPLTWADLPNALPGENIPELPIASLKVSQIDGLVLSGMSAMGIVPLPAELAEIPEDPAKWKIDRLEALLNENSEEWSPLQKWIGTQPYQAIREVLTKLEEKAADPTNNRTLRALTIPTDVKLSYRGRKTRVDMNLKSEGSNEFSAVFSELKESVTFRVTGEDYTTPEKLITLVPAPSITDLKRTEYRPAYLYQRPVYDDSATADALKSSPEKLKGLKQEVPDLGISLTGDRSRFDIPAGTELILSASVDKELQKAELLPKAGKFPGIAADKEGLRIPLELSEDKKTVTFTFSTEKGNLITRATEFELFFLDADNVSSKRAMLINVEEDQAPEVEATVEVIRKVGTTYLCTARALIPFGRESRIRDKQGLNRIEYAYNYLQQDTSAELSIRAAFASSIWINSPLAPNLGDFAWKSSILTVFGDEIRSAQKPIDGDPILLKSFTTMFNEPDRGGLLTLENIKSRLKIRPEAGERSGIIRSFDFKTANEVGFDLQKDIRKGGANVRLERQSDEEIQKHYILTLNIRAIDTNVESGPRIGENKEPFVFRVVSEEELLSEIAREQSDLALKVDDALKRLRDCERKLEELGTELPAQAMTSDFTGGATKAQKVSEELARAKDLTSEVSTDYLRISREYFQNRFVETRQRDLNERIVRPLESILTREFADSEEAHNPLSAQLNNNQLPAPVLLTTDKQKMTTLIIQLEKIRAEMGVVLGINNLVDKLRRIKEENDKRIRDGLKTLLERKVKEVFAPSLRYTAKGPVTVAPGQKVKFTLDIDWKDEQKDPHFLFLTSAEPTLKFAPSVELKDTQEKTEIEITAGDKKGDFDLKIEQTAGKAITVKVSVK